MRRSVVLILVVAGIFAAVASASSPVQTATLDPCPSHYSGGDFKAIAEQAWSEQKWRDSTPVGPGLMKQALRERRCAVTDHARVRMRSIWLSYKHRFYRYRAYKLRWGDCTDAGPPRDCIHGAALTYHADESWMLRVSYCESTWDRFAVNSESGSSGFFQFQPSTWKTTPYGGKSIWSEKWQSLAAAWMQAVAGRSGEWVCV